MTEIQEVEDAEAIKVEIQFSGREMKDIVAAAQERDESVYYVIHNAVMEDLFR